MNRIVLKSRVNKDGILKLNVPADVAGADEEVLVTIEPIDPSSMSVEEWQRGILELAGSWEGPFERPEQGDYEVRDSFQ